MIYLLRLTVLVLFIIGTMGAFYIGFKYPIHAIVFLSLIIIYVIIEDTVNKRKWGLNAYTRFNRGY